jgi:hypothetical protein
MNERRDAFFCFLAWLYVTCNGKKSHFQFLHENEHLVTTHSIKNAVLFLLTLLLMCMLDAC